MAEKKLFFASFRPAPAPHVEVIERDAELVGNLYMFEMVDCCRSRVSVDEVGSLLSNDLTVGETKSEALSLLRCQFDARAGKLEAKAKKLRQYAGMCAEADRRSS